MSLQRRMELITGLCVWLLAGLSVASPPPRLGWSKATLLMDPIAGVGPVRFELECPGGKLSPCSPRRAASRPSCPWRS